MLRGDRISALKVSLKGTALARGPRRGESSQAVLAWSRLGSFQPARMKWQV